MNKQILIALRYTVITAVLLGLGYPLVITAIAHLAFPARAAGQLVYDSHGALVGSALLGQPFTGDTYFHSRPSAAGTGYDASSSSGSNLGPTSKALDDRIQASVTAEHQPSVPIDLVTTSASGLDPDITPAAAFFQVGRVAKARGLSETTVSTLVTQSITPRQFGFFGEPRVNVLLLNRALDQQSTAAAPHTQPKS